jgi:cysteine-rich repeat protein
MTRRAVARLLSLVALTIAGCTEHGRGGTALLCGNGAVDEDEMCDDGNDVSGDGCSAECRIEACGNGILDREAGEVCDDGNHAAGDGCSPDCHSTEVCGNAILDPGEQCDDGNQSDADACDTSCHLVDQ